MNQAPLRGIAAFTLLAGLAGAASAHTGHGTESFFTGLAHPLGLDHLLAMVAVGLWSVFALPARRAWAGPAAFLLALVFGAAVGTLSAASGGAQALANTLLEPMLAASVVMFGALLVALVSRRPVPVQAGLALIALAAVLHGFAHGAEAPASADVAGYALGFMLTSLVLHALGAAAGLGLRAWLSGRARQAAGGLGLACSGVGLVLLLSL